MVDIARIKAKASKVSGQYMAMKTAYRDESNSRTEILEAILKETAPALPAIVSTHENIVDYETGKTIPPIRAAVISGPPWTTQLWFAEDGTLWFGRQDVNGGPVKLIQCPADEAASLFGVVEVASAIERLLEGQLKGKATKRAEEARKLAKRLHAVVALLEGE